MPMRNLLSILGAVAVGVWAYFGIIERLNSIETKATLAEADLEKNTEFRIKWPRGENKDTKQETLDACVLEWHKGETPISKEDIKTEMDKL